MNPNIPVSMFLPEKCTIFLFVGAMLGFRLACVQQQQRKQLVRSCARLQWILVLKEKWCK